MGNENNDPTPQNDPTPAPAPEPTPAPAPAPQPEPEGDGGAGGKPSDDQRDARLERENAAYKEQLDKLQGEIEALKTADDKEAEIRRITEQAATDKAALTKNLADTQKSAAIDVALAAKGCLDVQMAHAAIDMDSITLADDGTISGFDVDAFSKTKPFLFAQPVAKVSTGAPENGGGAPAEVKSIHDAVAATMKKKE